MLTLGLAGAMACLLCPKSLSRVFMWIAFAFLGIGLYARNTTLKIVSANFNKQKNTFKK